MTQGNRPGADIQKPADFNGYKVLWSALIGAVIGVVLSLFLDTFIRNTPATIRQTRLHYLYGVVISSAALFSASIESMRQLQDSAPEEDYRTGKSMAGKSRR